MTFKEKLDPNSNFNSQLEWVLESGNSLADSKRRNSRRDRTQSKNICDSGRCFNVVGNSRVPFPETINSIARFIGSQAVLEAYRTE